MTELHQIPANLNENCDGVLYCVAKWSYDVTGGLFWTLVLFGFITVLFIATQRFGVKRAFGFSGFAAITGSLFLATLNLMPYWIASAFILGGVISLASMIIGEN
jgi:hypothetical protein